MELSGEEACAILENYATDNIEDFAQDILQKVIDEMKRTESENARQPDSLYPFRLKALFGNRLPHSAQSYSR